MHMVWSKKIIISLASCVVLLCIVSCSPRVVDIRTDTVASVGGEKITVQDIREVLGVRGAAHRVFNATPEEKKEALDRIIAGKLLEEEGRRRGFDQTETFKNIVAEREKELYIAALFRERIDGKVHVKEDEIKAEAGKMMREDGKLSEDTARKRATTRLYQNRFRERDDQLIQEVKKTVKIEWKNEEINKVISGEAVADETTVALIDGNPVSYGEVNLELSRIAGHGSKDLAKDPRTIQVVLERLSVREGLYSLAKKEGVEKKESFVEVKGNFESSTIINLLIQNDIRKETRVSDEELVEFYRDHPEMFERGSSVRARHILVDDEESAREIYEKINRGADFENMAKEFSKDPSADKGGDLGRFGRGVMAKPFEDAVFSMKKGEVSEPVRTRFGYHIIQVTEREKGEIIPFSDARDQLEKSLINKKINNEVISLVESLKEGTEIRINEKALELV